MLSRRSFLIGGLSAVAGLALAAGSAEARTSRADADKALRTKIRAVDHGSIGTTFELGLDETVVVFVPEHYRLPKDKKVDFIVHFHGYGSNAKDVIASHKLRDQVRESRQNVVLVVPQGPVGAADGDFGRLMRKDGVANLLVEVRGVLSTHTASGELGHASLRGSKATGRVVLSSHSGGYHAVALNLKNSSVREVYLFDSLYDDLPTFRAWLTSDTKHHKLVSYYVAGKPLLQSIQLAKLLEEDGIDVVREERGKLVTRAELTKNRAVFLFGKANHATAVSDERPLRECLRASCLHGMGNGAWLRHKRSPRETGS